MTVQLPSVLSALSSAGPFLVRTCSHARETQAQLRTDWLLHAANTPYCVLWSTSVREAGVQSCAVRLKYAQMSTMYMYAHR